MKGISFQGVSAAAALGLAVVEFSFSRLGNGLVSVFIAVCLVLNEISKSPTGMYLKIRGFAGVFFPNSAKLARKSITVITFGGTLLIIDQFFEVEFIPWFDPLQTIIKRVAPILVIASGSIYLATVTASVISRIVIENQDRILRSLELNFYVFTMIFICLNTIFWIGFPAEVFIPSAHGNQGDMELPIWPWFGFMFKFWTSTIMISLLWIISTFLCIVSRYTESRFIKYLRNWNLKVP